MKNNTKQAVILDNFSSPYIYQAILILKDCNPALEDKIIADAEQIVSSYLNRPQLQSIKKRHLSVPYIILFIASSAVFGAILSYII